MKIGTQTRLTAVVGSPIKHSLSPLLHNAIYAREGIDAAMLAIENDSVKGVVAAIRALSIGLTAITIPHKQNVLPLLDKVGPAAQKIGAVNTIINKNGLLTGFNTDFVGIAKSLEKVALRGKNVLIIGAGGAARPVAFHLSRVGAKIYCYNRSRENAKALCKDFGGSVVTNLKAIPFDVIINTTPIVMSPNVNVSPIPAEILRHGSTVFDVIYNPLETKLLKDAKRAGARTISGLMMFVAQGLEQERLWLGKTIKNRGYERLLKAELTKRK